MSAVLFDLDGTPVDSLAGIHATASAVLAERGHLPPERDALQALVGAPLESIFGTLVPRLGESERLEYADHYRRLYWTVGVPHTPLFPGISELLSELTRVGILLAVVTTKRADVAAHVLAAAGIAQRFRAVIGGDSTPHHKPHPAPAFAALDALGSVPPEATVVGDTTFDMLMAAAVGCRAIGVDWGYGTRESLEVAGASAIAADVPQLRDFLLGVAR